MKYHSALQQGKAHGGFTLVEMIVATSVFSVCILVLVGSLIAMQGATRKARAIREASSNVGSVMDSMSRTIRMGSGFNCGCVGAPPYPATPANCSMDNSGAGGATCLAFEKQKGNPLSDADNVVYRQNGTRIERSLNGGTTWETFTSPNITIDTLKFFVDGTERGAQYNQPYITIFIRGTAFLGTRHATSLQVQTTVAARAPNYMPL